MSFKPISPDIFFAGLLTVITITSSLVILTHSAGIIRGYHLGDIGYAAAVYLLIYFLFRLIGKKLLLPRIVMALGIMISLELAQLVGWGKYLIATDSAESQFIGQYVFGTEFRLIEIGIYFSVIGILAILETSLRKKYDNT